MDLPPEHAPLATPMPAPPSRDILSNSQWATVYAILDGALPSVASMSTVEDANSQLIISDDRFNKIIEDAAKAMLDAPPDEVLAGFLKHRPVDDPHFQDDVLRTLARSPALPKLVGVLDFLNTRLGALLLTGRWMPIQYQPTRVREAIIKSWSTSRLGSLRNLAKGMFTIAQKAHAITSPLHREMYGYTDIPKDWTARQGFDYNFIQFEAGSEPQVITTDVVIVGSGPGGGVSAKNLADAGHDVLVLDKGYHFPPDRLPMPQDAAIHHLFDGSSVYITESGNMGIVAGGAWGGGGTINWSVCLRLQDYIRREWADAGLPFFTSKDFDASNDRVCDFVGAGTDAIRHNHRNSVLLQGAKTLGWKHGVAPQNTAGKEHFCGQCHLGCGLGEKQGPAQTWLPAAAEAGARFAEGFYVEKVLFAEDGVTATGVEGVWTGRDEDGNVHTPLEGRVQRRVVVRAKKVVVTCGCLQSPLILKRSGLDNPHIGKNLHLHPASMLSAIYEEDTRPWEGGIITSFCSEFENLDEKGHGTKLEPTAMVPYTILPMLPWSGGLEAKLLLLKYRNQASFISLTRDRDTGSVFEDPKTGRPRIDYDTSAFDCEHAVEGLVALAKVCYVTGATELRAHVQGLEAFAPSRDAAKAEGKDPEFADEAFAAWLARLRKLGNGPAPALSWSSAHQMGSVRMGATEAQGAVDGKGKAWGREGLFVADSSVFPSASAVNPMITVMAIADWVSRNVDKELRAGK